MTEKETTVFNKYKAIILHVQSLIKRKYESYRIVGNKASDEISSDILNLSARTIIEKGVEEKPDTEVRAFLYTWFRNTSQNLYRKEKRRIEKSVPQEALDNLEDETGSSYEESSERLARYSLGVALKGSSNDIKALCKVHLEHGSFDAAIRELGWSKGKVYRTKRAVKALFGKKIISCGGYFEPRDISKWKGSKNEPTTTSTSTRTRYPFSTHLQSNPL